MNNGKNWLYDELFAQYGAVTRARGTFLYTKKNIRITDLYQENGRAILGWGGQSACGSFSHWTRFKNILNRGLTGSWKTEYEYQTQKAVESLLSSKRVLFFYFSRETALKSALTISVESTCVFRPWNPIAIDWKTQEAVIIAPPLPWTENIDILAVLPEAVEMASLAGKKIAPSERIPSPLNAAIARSIFDLEKALKDRKEKDFFIYDTILTKFWERKGPYLFPKMPELEYKSFALNCLNNKIFISPNYNEPSIVPFGANSSVFKDLNRL